MADEEILDHQQELSDLKEEYAKLQEHLTNVEIRYQTELTESNQQRHNDFAVRLQDVVVNLFGRSQFSDLKVLLENGSDLSVHKLVLLARSEDWGVPDLDEVDILDLRGIKYEVAYGMMKWVYTDEMDVEEEDDYLVELLKTATKYKLEALHIRCQNMMISIVNLDNANKFYIAATESSAELLKDHCMEFLSKHQTIEISSMDNLTDDVQIDEEKDRKLSSEFKTPKPDPVDGTATICQICRKSFHNKDTIEIHSKTHNGKSEAIFGCFTCNKITLRLKDLKTCFMISGEKKLVCKTCISSSAIEKEIEKVFTEHPYECGICGALFLRKFYLVNHLRRHSGERPFQCEFCGQGFKRDCTLNDHRKTHTGVKPHVCSVCGKSFARLYHLRRHFMMHSGEKPYQCNDCGKFCRQIHAHMKSHAKTAGKIHK